MGKVALITQLGERDNGINLDPDNYPIVANLDVLKAGVSKINLEALLNEMSKKSIVPNEVAMDLLVISISMFTADTKISRKTYSDDSWTRQISLYIPVSNVTLWNSQVNLLQDIFRFLTGDIWEISFRARINMDPIAPRISANSVVIDTDTVCLFSGGMDSFIGAINLLSEGVVPLLIGHYKSGVVSPYQRNCAEVLGTTFVGNIHLVQAYLRAPNQGLFNSSENTERGRSFLFLSIGGVFASALSDNSTLYVPENGLISLNLPLTPLRVGSHSTRTTHPYYMNLMQKLFDNLGLNVNISNPYQQKTKGEMLRECVRAELLEEATTMSCSSPSSRHGEGQKHCGYCVPCIIRRASFLSAGIIEPENSYKVDIFNPAELNTPKKRDHIVAFKYLIEKQRRNPNYLHSLIRTTGELGNDVSEYICTYQRGLEEVEALLSSVVYE